MRLGLRLGRCCFLVPPFWLALYDHAGDPRASLRQVSRAETSDRSC